MLLTVMQALGELAVVYPVNGAFYQYMVRFIDPAWYVRTEMLDGKSFTLTNSQGICRRLGLRDQLAHRTAVRAYRCWFHYSILAPRLEYRNLGGCILCRTGHHPDFRRPWLW